MRGNPFTYGNPISDPRRFVGRVREVEQIFGRLLNEEFESSSLVGDRRIGKTSLLKYLADPSVRETRGLGVGRYSFVYVDLQMVDQAMDPDRLWHRLLTLMQRQCADQRVTEAVTALVGQGRLDGFDLEELFQQVDDNGHHVVFLMDEFEHVTANTNFGPDFYYRLRSLMIHHGVALVTSSRLELAELCHSKAVESSPFFNVFANIRLRIWSNVPSRGRPWRSRNRRRNPWSGWPAFTRISFKRHVTCSTRLTSWSSACSHGRTSWLKGSGLKPSRTSSITGITPMITRR
jgi:hypothetical protein